MYRPTWWNMPRLPMKLIISDNLIFKGSRIVVPRSARQEIIDRIHSSHIGINGCIRRAREAVYYPGLTADIKRVVGNCETCQRYLNDLQKEPFRSHTAPSGPWQKVGVDIFTFRDQD